MWINGRYIGPMREGDNGGASGGGGGSSSAGNSGGGDPPSLPPTPPPAAPSTPPPAAGGGGNAPRKRKQPAARTKVAAGGGSVSASHTDASGNRVTASAPTPALVVDKIADLPTPGGLVLLLVVLLLFLFAIVPVNGGKTRLQLLWDTLRGKTSLPAPKGQPTSNVNAAVSSGESAVSEGIAAALGVPGADVAPISQGIAAGIFGQIPQGPSGGAGMSPAIPEYQGTGYDYVDQWQGPELPQGYPGETVYDTGMFPEIDQ